MPYFKFPVPVLSLILLNIPILKTNHISCFGINKLNTIVLLSLYRLSIPLVQPISVMFHLIFIYQLACMVLLAVFEY